MGAHSGRSDATCARPSPAFSGVSYGCDYPFRSVVSVSQDSYLRIAFLVVALAMWMMLGNQLMFLFCLFCRTPMTHWIAWYRRCHDSSSLLIIRESDLLLDGISRLCTAPQFGERYKTGVSMPGWAEGTMLAFRIEEGEGRWTQSLDSNWVG